VGVEAKCKRGGGSGAGATQKGRGAGKGGERGSGPAVSAPSNRERGSGCKRREITSGPYLSAAGEREEGKGDGRLGRLGLQAESEGEEGRWISFFIFESHFHKHLQYEF